MSKPSHPASLAGWTLVITIAIAFVLAGLAAPRAEAAEPAQRADTAADDADLEAVFAYLRTIPPIRNQVPEPWAPVAAAK